MILQLKNNNLFEYVNINKLLYLIAFLVLLVNSKISAQNINSEIDITGQWAGVLTQPNSKKALAAEYPFNMEIFQNEDSIWGVTSIEVNNTPYFANIKFHGKINNNIVTFQETEIINQKVAHSSYFCIKNGTLIYDKNNIQFTGTWNSNGGCGPGKIFLIKNEPFKQSEVIKDTVKNEVSEIENVEGVEIVENKLQVENIYFDTGKYELTDDAETELNKIFKFMVINNDVKIFISGHTDNVGDENELLELSENRVETVKNYLIEKGIDTERITGKGYGSSKPLSDDDTKEGHAKNRRIEFEIIKN